MASYFESESHQIKTGEKLHSKSINFSFINSL